MTVADWLLVVAGALVGAPIRYLLGAEANHRLSSGFPLGTFAANSAAALLLGYVVRTGMGAHLTPERTYLLGAGFCGALSTWSTFSYELLTLTSKRRLVTAAAYLLLTVGTGVGLSFAGAAAAAF